ncbi:MAG TPA: bifunctional DNA-binding transcriptional regulator/O6-methylguanine-DNA methyltransferase Ada [Gemmatimonadales bacterium]|nr:bifunctional DNA-binding transcriptional regulator/O6-methylguanine-DNA methyltransferase Ada [Gemmatimonadales bacterium]
MKQTLEDTCWNAVLERDAAFDGSFVFAVRTTGIYCRPSCPSRRPRRQNVEFFAAPGDAAAAGYRACRRCEPNAAETAAERAVARARAYLDAHVGEPVTLATLAREVGMSAHHLQRTFKRSVGVSPAQYASALRAERLKVELRSGATVSRASYDAGYGASSRVYDAAEHQLGMTPAAYRRGGKGVRIRFTTVRTDFGWLLVAATDLGVCSVMLGDGAVELRLALKDEFPSADLAAVDMAEDGHDDLRAWAASITEHLQGKSGSIAVELDVGGTPLQQRVWSALRQIPYGETRSYAELAAAAGAPRAIRAVASACARNPVALVVPCHRAVRKGGALGGYRWGIERKARLLAHERGVVVRRVQRV